MQCSQVVQLARVGVRVLVLDVVCVMLVLIARVVVLAVNTVFVANFLQLEMYSLHYKGNATFCLVIRTTQLHVNSARAGMKTQEHHEPMRCM